MANVSRFTQRLRASTRWQGARKRVRAASGAVAGVLGAAAAMALFTSTPWAHGPVQVVIWVAAAVALVVCLVASAASPGESVGTPVTEETRSGAEEATQIVPIPGRGLEGYMGLSDDAVEKRHENAGLSSPPAISDPRAGREPAS